MSGKMNAWSIIRGVPSTAFNSRNEKGGQGNEDDHKGERSWETANDPWDIARRLRVRNDA